MAESGHFQVITTTDSEQAAALLARGIIKAKTGACVQVFPIRSFYRWEGRAQDDPEWRLEVKTSATRLPALIEHISTHHTYDVPEVIVTSIVDGNRAYLDWVEEETQER
ncbi:MAG: divalent-cation tolerance protein CutA [Actinomycetota bacterium]|nr:divalent-cation tolerance protein CutA [Actinomycetota bacterium]